MSEKHNKKRVLGVYGDSFSPIVGGKPAISHPQNCKKECPYGYDRPFCWPCMKKLKASTMRSSRV